MTNLDSALKKGDITLSVKVCVVEATVFPVVYGCKSWTIKKAENQRINAFKLWFWRRLLRVTWISRQSNQSILKEINPEYSWRTVSEAEAGILWTPYAKNWLIERDPDADKDWWQKEKGAAEGEMFR